MDVVRAKVAATPTPASVEESRENRLQRLKSRFRDRGGRVPTGENKLVGILLAHRTAHQRRSRSRSLSPVKPKKAVKAKKAKKQPEDESVAGPSTVKVKLKTKAKPKPTTETKAKRRGRPPKGSVDEPPTEKMKAKTKTRKSTAAAPPDDDSEDIPLSKVASKKPHTARPPPMTPIPEADEGEDTEAETVVSVSKERKKALPDKLKTPSKSRSTSRSRSKAVEADEDAAVDMPPKGSRAGSSKSKSRAKVRTKALKDPRIVIQPSSAPSVEALVGVTASSKLKGRAKTMKDVDQAISASAERLSKLSTSQAAKITSGSSKSKARARIVEDGEIPARRAAKASTKVRKAKDGNDTQPAPAASSSKLKGDDKVRSEKPPPKSKRPRTDEDEDEDEGGGVVKKPRVEVPQATMKKRKAKDVLGEVKAEEKLAKRSRTSKSLVVPDDVVAVPKTRMKTSTSKLKENVRKAPKKAPVRKGPRKSVVARLHAPLPPIEDEDEADPIDFLS